MRTDSTTTQTRLAGLMARAGAVLLWERFWIAAAPALGLIALFVAVSWLGLWQALPPLGRQAGVVLFGAAFVISLWRVLRIGVPDRAARLTRLDRDVGRAHRIATSFDDQMAPTGDDAGARALWLAHKARIESALDQVRVAAPSPGLARRDMMALRAAPLLALAAGFFVAGPERAARLASAFDWRAPIAVAAAPAWRIDGWIDPPAYTRFPPLVLDLQRGGADHVVRSPAHGVIVIRAAGRDDIGFEATGALGPKESTGSVAGVVEQRWTIRGDGVVTVKVGGKAAGVVQLSAIADTVPEIRLVAPPEPNLRGTFNLITTAKDDYGVVSAEARFTQPRLRGKPPTGRRALAEPPVAPLQIPGAADGETPARSVVDLSSHPWAGAEVSLTLAAKDDLGQEGVSEVSTYVLPQRPFAKPLAKALTEQRRLLAIDPDRRGNVLDALHALAIAPERFMPEKGYYLGLRAATQSLTRARTDADLLDVAEQLWTLALAIEDGDLSDAERQLRAAQEALRQALERGASEDEVRKLTQDLRAALDQFLREFAEKMQRENQQRGDQQQPQRDMSNLRTVTPEDLKSLLDRMEEMARTGDMAEAQRMLEQLQSILENLQTARPQRGQRDPMMGEMERSLDELEAMTKEQEQLRDRTFRENQRQQRNRMGQNQRGRQGERGQQGERGPRGQRGQQGEQGQPGEQGEGESEAGEGGEGGEGMQSLSQRQDALRQKLQDLQRRMRGMGMNPEKGLGDAEGEMGDAQGSMGRGQGQQAIDSQGRAIENLRRGAQGMAQQMQQQMGDGTEQAEGGEGEGPGTPGQPRSRADRRDPLGRDRNGGDRFDRNGDDGTRLGARGYASDRVERAKRVLEELRRRFGQSLRPQEELDYLERLLRMR